MQKVAQMLFRIVSIFLHGVSHGGFFFGLVGLLHASASSASHNRTRVASALEALILRSISTIYLKTFGGLLLECFLDVLWALLTVSKRWPCGLGH
jgi:hypothetical protein